MVVEIVAGVLIAVLAAVTIIAAFIGVAGMFGRVHFNCCEHCGRLLVVPSSHPRHVCVGCVHERVRHPIAAVHDAHHGHHHPA